MMFIFNMKSCTLGVIFTTACKQIVPLAPNLAENSTVDQVKILSTAS